MSISTESARTALVVGAGPGLGLSMAHRFGREGLRVALISRNGARHPEYLSTLGEAGVAARAFVADVHDRDQLRQALDAATDEFGGIDVLYYGPGAGDPSLSPEPITATTAADGRRAMRTVYGAIDVVNHLLPGMIARGNSGLLFAGGLSAVTPMPALGSLALLSSALRTYALALNAALAERGVYAGTVTIGGLIERGDIHRAVMSQIEKYGDVANHALDPDAIADTAWQLYAARDQAEAIVTPGR